MDLWVVAAAAGAGYVAKNLQNSSLDKKENLIEQSYKYTFSVQSESRNFLQQLRDKTCPLRKLGRKGAQNYAFPDSDLNFTEIDRLNNSDLESELASIGGNALEKDRLNEDYNMNRRSVFSAEFEDGENRSSGRVRNGKIISRRPRLNPIRPLRSIGSCLENMEDNSCLYPSISAVRPVLFTDGSRIISKSSSCSSFTQFEGCKVEERLVHSREPDTMLLFITGMTIGIMSATTAWKNEVDKLNTQLKQMQNFVQDLHEELDMKEMLMVKELTNEGFSPPGENHSPLSIQEPISSPYDVKTKNLTKFDSPEAINKDMENPELMSKIEAELQAELEMLEHNMKASAIERISDVVELDPDFEPEIVKGDLKSTIANGICGDSSESGPTNCSRPPNNAVCPWELSLRLHELIESRLEKRVKELEIALENSQNRARVLASQNVVSKRRLSYSETESSSTHQSPTCIYDEQEMEYEYILNHSVVMEEGGLLDSVQDFPETRDKKMSTNFMLNEDSGSEDDGSGDESEMLLIKQILERRRSGSSFNLKI
ncbi:hypothetical protein BUALT_Bualt17G0080500 [Buddleja alternifolia]|uniref:Uncharacterized protein n=1 Tax=Buddleja alternifolia TaxID=168488 RepID=A0AAV6WHI9_9LAMI|nr:hypothetical protein BUALT_Bualt17G0080500 [Buddleja alternifolia]